MRARPVLLGLALGLWTLAVLGGLHHRATAHELTERLHRVVFSPDGALVVVWTRAGRRFHDSATGREVRPDPARVAALPANPPPPVARFRSPDGRTHARASGIRDRRGDVFFPPRAAEVWVVTPAGRLVRHALPTGERLGVVTGFRRRPWLPFAAASAAALALWVAAVLRVPPARIGPVDRAGLLATGAAGAAALGWIGWWLIVETPPPPPPLRFAPALAFAVTLGGLSLGGLALWERAPGLACAAASTTPTLLAYCAWLWTRALATG